MADAALRRMTVEEFFKWQEVQDDLYELVDGLPILHKPLQASPARMMTGASVQHDRVTVNILSILNGQLRGTGCRPTTADISLRTSIATIRRPDVTVECGEMIRDTSENRSPRLVVEVLSPSTSSIDRFRKIDEYKHHPTLAYILLVETRWPGAVLYLREGDAWEIGTFDALADTIDLPAIGASLPLADIYDDLTFEPGRTHSPEDAR